MRIGLFAIAVSMVACGPIDSDKPTRHSSYPIVTTERGPQGGRLVFLAEDGRRMALLTDGEGGPVIDTNPAWSTDGKWVAFASSRDRTALEQTSLWIVEGRSNSKPRRLTSEESVDRDPVWTVNGKALVFSSNVAGSFDLWLLPLTTGEDGWPAPAGTGKQLTRSRFDELSPTLSPDGSRVVYMRYDRDTQRSDLWSVSIRGGQPRKITRGPADLTPSFSPDGKAIAFAAPIKGRDDTELFVIEPDGSNRRAVVDEPLSDQTGPRWSRDGRYLFATSVYRAESTGRPILSSLVVVDLTESPRVMRALHDPVAVESRIGGAIAPVDLDPEILRRNELYSDALKRTMVKKKKADDDQNRTSDETGP